MYLGNPPTKLDLKTPIGKCESAQYGRRLPAALVIRENRQHVQRYIDEAAEAEASGDHASTPSLNHLEGRGENRSDM